MKFDPTNKEHVEWLTSVFEKVDQYMDPSSEKNTRTLLDALNNNPVGLVLDHRNVRDWNIIHGFLCTQYAKAVLYDKNAYIPS